MKKKLCCIFNYAPLYRESIYEKIDDAFDTQFCFDEADSDIAKMSDNSFKKSPMVIKTKLLPGGLTWRRGIQILPFKGFDSFLIIGDFSIAFIPFLIICKILRKPVYAWGHGIKSWGGNTSFFSKLQFKLLTKYLTYGEGGRKRLIDMGVPSYKLDVIYNSLSDGVNVESMGELQSDEVQNHFANSLPTLIFVGRLTPVKQLDWIIDAMKHHRNGGLHYNLLIVGDGKERAKLELMVRNYDLNENVWFYGECYDEDKLNTLIYNTDLCVSPGNVGLTALHTIMYGTPVLSHDDFESQMPEYETIVEGKTGLLYKHGDKQDFFDKIELWLSMAVNREEVRSHCYNMINGKWNSQYQIELLKSLIK